MNDKIMDSSLQAAIKNSPNYSKQFATIVESIGDEIMRCLALPFSHDTNMNYSASHRLLFAFDIHEQPLPPDTLNSARYRLILFISSKGNFYTLWCKAPTSELNQVLFMSRPIWHKLASELIPVKIQDYMDSIKQVMTKLGYLLLPDSLLDREVEGFVTDLDHKPATLFEILFSEVH